MAVSPRTGAEDDGGRALRIYLLCILLAFVIIVLRLAYLQLMQHRLHLKTSYDNVMRSAVIPPPRGTIYDRSGRVLAISKQNYGLLFVPPPDLRLYMPSSEVRRLLKITGRTYHYLQNRGDSPNQAKRVPHDEDEDEHPRLWEILDEQRPGELMADLVRLKAQVPEQDAIAQQLYVVWPYPGTLRSPADVWSFSASAAGGEYAQHVETLRAYLDQNESLGQEYDNDARRLVSYHLDDVLTDPAATSVQLASAVHACLADSLLLGQWYVDRLALSRVDVRTLRLEPVVGLASYLRGEFSYEALMARLDQQEAKSFSHEPLKVVEELTPEQRLYVAEHIDQFDDFIIEEYSFRRLYTLGPDTAHLLGYVGAPTEQQIGTKTKPGLGYDRNERAGKAGVELQYETLLRGKAGERRITISRAGAYQEELDVIAPTRGTDLYLGIDAELQAKVNRVLQQELNESGKPGAIIVSSLQPENPGQILALASSPTYDATRLREPGYYAKLQLNKWKPELNRAVGHCFPPGSTFKIVTLAAALTTGTSHWGDGFHCHGFMDIGDARIAPQRRFWCHIRGSGHGGVNVRTAFAKSCDVGFYNMGLRLDKAGDASEILHDYALKFGYGSPTGIDLPDEPKGTVPNRDWKYRALEWAFRRTGSHSDQNWYDGDTLNYSIGQGFLAVTPLQVLWSANTVAWNGVRYRPQVLVARTGSHGLQAEPTPEPEQTDLDLHVLGQIKEAMRAAVLEGTCQSLGRGPLASLQVCAKTGTAETGHGTDHSWVVGFFPKDNPRYSFVCFFEHGGHAGDAAVPAAHALLEWIQKKDPLARPAATATAP